MESTTEFAGLMPTQSPLQVAQERLELARCKAQTKLMESLISIEHGNIIDPLERFKGENGELWTEIGTDQLTGQASIPILTEEGQKAARAIGRKLAFSNEFAIGGHENRISYIVGSGHEYDVMARKDTALAAMVDVEVATDREAKEAVEGPATEAIAVAQMALDEFTKRNKWHKRQQETVLRNDRDGEVFYRFFKDADFRLTVRFVEPGQVFRPDTQTSNPNATFGILTKPGDVETVEKYFIDGQPVEPKEIQHRKSNVDLNVKRGLPLFFPCTPNLERAEKLLRNMGTVSGIQAAFAMIRKRTAPQSTAQALIQANADASIHNTATGKTTHFRQYGPGTILDTDANTEYTFPTGRQDAPLFVTVLQAELRAVASRLAMPEFMFSADASNANFASTMVAEGPAVKMFERLQATQINADLEIMDMVLDLEVEAGRLQEADRAQMEIAVTTPTLVTRDQFKESEADGKAVLDKRMSKRTARVRLGLDPDFEEAEVAKEKEAADPFAGMPGGNPLFQPTGGLDDDDDDDGDGD